MRSNSEDDCATGTLDVMRPTKLVFIGDSITDSGRRRPIGEGPLDRPLGDGFVSLFEAILTATRPAHQIRIVNMGTSGNTVRDLTQRWDSDVIELEADHVVVMIGINDVWRRFTRALQPEFQIDPDGFRAELSRLIERSQSAGIGVTLATPYFLERNRRDAMREHMDLFADQVRELARHYRLMCVDTQHAFDSILEDLHPMQIALDRVHLNLAGHMVLAWAMFRSLVGYSDDLFLERVESP